jgi:hypothetical protein
VLWGTHWELGEHICKLMIPKREKIGNQGKKKKKTPPPPPQTNLKGKKSKAR